VTKETKASLTMSISSLERRERVIEAEKDEYASLTSVNLFVWTRVSTSII